MTVEELTAEHHGWLIKVGEHNDHRTFLLGKGFGEGVRPFARPDGSRWVGLIDESDKRPGIVGTERIYPVGTPCELLRPVTRKARQSRGIAVGQVTQ